VAAAGAGHITAAAVVQLERAHCCGMHTCCCATRLIRSQQPFKISQCTLALLPSSVCTTKRSVSTICRPSTSAALIRANRPRRGAKQGRRHSTVYAACPAQQGWACAACGESAVQARAKACAHSSAVFSHASAIQFSAAARGSRGTAAALEPFHEPTHCSQRCRPCASPPEP